MLGRKTDGMEFETNCISSDFGGKIKKATACENESILSISSNNFLSTLPGDAFSTMQKKAYGFSPEKFIWSVLGESPFNCCRGDNS